MAQKTPKTVIDQVTQRIERVRQRLAEIDFVCSGTLATRKMACGKPTCRCHTDPEARHGPYNQWGHMKGGKLVHRYVSDEQAVALRQAIINFRELKKLLRTWETETERLIDAKYPR